MTRYSVNQDDPGHKSYLSSVNSGKTLTVFLDGIEQKNAITADEEAGEVTRHVVNADGRVMCNPSQPSELWTETVTGKVEVFVR